jgi:hypothetical protein
MTSEQAGAILATLYISVHKTPPPPDAPSLRDWFVSASRVPGVPEHIATGVLTLIERLPPGEPAFFLPSRGYCRLIDAWSRWRRERRSWSIVQTRGPH